MQYLQEILINIRFLNKPLLPRRELDVPEGRHSKRGRYLNLGDIFHGVIELNGRLRSRPSNRRIDNLVARREELIETENELTMAMKERGDTFDDSFRIDSARCA
jgi:hypothetical protein